MKAKDTYSDRMIDFLASSENIGGKKTRTFLDRIKSGRPFIKEDNLDDHICSFFVPVDRKRGRIYLGHHIKAGKWIPPGGHIKHDEMPVETVHREFEEELGLRITSEKVVLFDLGVRVLEPNPRHNCKIHHDFWFYVETAGNDFKFLKSEFYDAGWFSYPDTLRKIEIPQYNEIVKNLISVL